MVHVTSYDEIKDIIFDWEDTRVSYIQSLHRRDEERTVDDKYEAFIEASERLGNLVGQLRLEEQTQLDLIRPEEQ
jgi:hypothetical protein